MEIISLNVGKSSIISLPSFAMSGYLWSFQVDRTDVILVSEEKTLPGNSKPGESLNEKFRIQGLKSGIAKLVFNQKRSWEQNTAALSTLIFSVVVS